MRLGWEWKEAVETTDEGRVGGLGGATAGTKAVVGVCWCVRDALDAREALDLCDGRLRLLSMTMSVSSSLSRSSWYPCAPDITPTEATDKLG